MMSDEDRLHRDGLAEQMLHADTTGVLSGELALRLAEVAISYCKGHPFPPPADFAN